MVVLQNEFYSSLSDMSEEQTYRRSAAVKPHHLLKHEHLLPPAVHSEHHILVGGFNHSLKTSMVL